MRRTKEINTSTEAEQSHTSGNHLWICWFCLCKSCVPEKRCSSFTVLHYAVYVCCRMMAGTYRHCMQISKRGHLVLADKPGKGFPSSPRRPAQAWPHSFVISEWHGFRPPLRPLSKVRTYMMACFAGVTNSWPRGLNEPWLGLFGLF